jgi:phospholipase/lecithinase/hemolysin
MLSHLGLAFGICDLKESPDGVLHFLEVNPQGQFAFWDALVPGANVCSAVAGYLLALARGDVVVPSASLESASA